MSDEFKITRYIENESPKANKNLVEVVRCGECKWYGNEQKKIYECCTYWAQNGGVLVPMNADDFCSYGEREGE